MLPLRHAGRAAATPTGNSKVPPVITSCRAEYCEPTEEPAPATEAGTVTGAPRMVVPPTRRTSWPSVSGNVKISFACSSAKSVGVASGSGAGKVLRSVVSLMRLSLLISKSITYTLNPSSLAKCSPAFCVGGASGLPQNVRSATYGAYCHGSDAAGRPCRIRRDRCFRAARPPARSRRSCS
jgi:hypothetical protein